MERFASAADLVAARKPERPVLCARPHAAARAARWFVENFDGDVAYAYKANSSVFLIGALYGAGIRHFDVASLPEIEDAATIPGAELHFMHPVKSREAIRRAYHQHGVRSFSLDTEDELKKIVEETAGEDGPARDLALFVRVSVPAINSRIPLERKFGTGGQKAARLLVKARQVAAELGITFHVGSQTMTPDAYVNALAEVQRLIGKAGVVVDRLDVGGGFPSIYPGMKPAPLARFLQAIRESIDKLPVRENVRLMCEPGRALVAEAESLIVRVEARRGNDLFINDGGYGVLFDAAHLGWIYPARLINREPAGGEAPISYELWGPTCDSIDHMKGPFVLPACIKEGDYLEIGNVGAYGRAIAGDFNGYGKYEEAILDDEPMMTMYGEADAAAALLG
ncbi:MAG: type III PLP-dependent enzyme [Hyphomicrobium zavarzinii]|uniref:type III PLP-dependent enzyme n=1 Tax=Hyphomicrobium zavarzinii TaxID=48292 RepID=UPI001A3BF14D|nr:type III PLP-dependent enzyme [Hyphomicrobium zavarzinii]MBL8844273.1 type III PLP-dependent enzyme [Hyphomicrobium zavarzinii]HML41985.1 type III PLP-dependent enzyme [Hyphomicrobium zavarzinii]